jgi:hypothetical protein
MNRLAVIAAMAVAVCDNEKEGKPAATAPTTIRLALAHAGDRLEAVLAREGATPTCVGLAPLVNDAIESIDQVSPRASAEEFERPRVDLTAALKLAIAKNCSDALTTDLSLALGDVADAHGMATRNPEPVQAPICAKLIACSDALVAGTGQSMESSYGATGACWKTSETRLACRKACEQGMEALKANPAFNAMPACHH